MKRKSNKLTFAQYAILNRIAKKQRVGQDEKFQDNIVHTDHSDYSDSYVVYCDYDACHGDYYDCDYGIPVPDDNSVAPKKTNLFQRIFNRFSRHR